MNTINEFVAEATRIATEHGFTENTVGEELMLIVTEIAEAMEDYRKGCSIKTTTYHSGGKASPIQYSSEYKPCGIPSEMADVVIRVMHFCGKHGIDLERAIREKMAYNATREFRHGKVM